MRVKILPRGVFGGTPLVLDATLVLVELSNGVPVMVSGEYGPDGAVRSSHAGDRDFNQSLSALGIERTIICDTLRLPPSPAGAKIIAGPGCGTRRVDP